MIAITASGLSEHHYCSRAIERMNCPNPLIWRYQMTTTNLNETIRRNEGISALSDETLDHVAGGVNPQPLPPRDPEPREFALRAR